jgi:AraC family transcriptional regulator of adaptative response / DNA-3-methyladenine glycosylase II
MRAPRDFDFPWVLEFLGARAVPGMEEIVGGTYRRSLRFRGQAIALELQICQNGVGAQALLARLTGNIERQVARRLLTGMFDLDADLAEFRSTIQADSLMRNLVRQHPDIRLPIYMDPFEGIVRAVCGQQVSLAAARTVTGRLVQGYGAFAPLISGRALYLFPDPGTLASMPVATIRNIGLTNAKASAIRTVANAVIEGSLCVEALRGAPPALIRDTLQSLPGIGPWTASYIQMRVFGDRDDFPASDLGVAKVLKETNKEAAEKRSLAWQPWRAYATLHLWNSLSHQ